MLHRTTPFLCLLLIVPGLLTPPGTALAEFDWNAKYAGDYISGQSSARLLALGGAGVAIANGPASVMANPARLMPDHRHGVHFMHADRFESAVKLDHAVYTRAAGDGRALGFGLVRQGVDDIPITRLRDPSQPLGVNNRVIQEGSTSASEYAFMLAYAMDHPYGRLGGTAKLLYKNLHENSAYGLGVDLGYARRFGDLHVGAQLRDALTSILAWDTGRQEGIVPTLRMGAAYELRWSRMNARILPIVEAQVRTESIDDDDALALHAGLEYTISNVVSARVGYDEDRLTYGAGVHIAGLRVDYAFVGHEDLGATHRVSLGYLWGALN